MSAFTIYRRDTGNIVAHYAGSARQLAHNVPEGCSAVLGRHDPLCQRIDDATGHAQDWQPPQASPDQAWDQERRRWVLSPQAQRKRAALSEIRRIERDEQPRAQREAMLGKGTERLQQIEDRIVELRAILTSPAEPPVS